MFCNTVESFCPHLNDSLKERNCISLPTEPVHSHKIFTRREKHCAVFWREDYLSGCFSSMFQIASMVFM